MVGGWRLGGSEVVMEICTISTLISVGSIRIASALFILVVRFLQLFVLQLCQISDPVGFNIDPPAGVG